MSSFINSTISSKRVIELALGLTPLEQSELLTQLHENLESIDRGSDHDAIWGAEIMRRVSEIESGQAKLIDHDTVMKEARELIAAR